MAKEKGLSKKDAKQERGTTRNITGKKFLSMQSYTARPKNL